MVLLRYQLKGKIMSDLQSNPRQEGEVVLFNHGDIIFKEGEEGGSIFLIVTGEVEIFKSLEGKKTVISKVERGDVLGTMSLIGDTKRTASARSIGITKCRKYDATKIVNISGEVPKWYQTILRDIMKRFSNLEVKYIKLLNEKDVKKRSPK